MLKIRNTSSITHYRTKQPPPGCVRIQNQSNITSWKTQRKTLSKLYWLKPPNTYSVINTLSFPSNGHQLSEIRSTSFRAVVSIITTNTQNKNTRVVTQYQYGPHNTSTNPQNNRANLTSPDIKKITCHPNTENSCALNNLTINIV